jgi:hypothetical protein
VVLAFELRALCFLVEFTHCFYHIDTKQWTSFCLVLCT